MFSMLFFVKDFYIKLYDCSFVVVSVTVVGSRKNGDHQRKIVVLVPFVHFEAFELGFMSSDDSEKLICIQEI